MSVSRVQDVARQLSIEVLSVGRLCFRLDTTAGVGVDVEPVSERVLRFRLNASSPILALHVQLSDDSSFALPETVSG